MTIPAAHQSAPDFKILAEPTPAPQTAVPPDVARWQADAHRFYLEAARMKRDGQHGIAATLRTRALKSLGRACEALADAEVAMEPR